MPPGLSPPSRPASNLISPMPASSTAQARERAHPSLEVSEGFASAWESDPDGFGSTMVHLKILNVPSGVTFIWPGQKHNDADGQS